MALTGTLLADFSSFQTAVDQSVVKLRTFEDGAGKVSTTLNKMTDSFSGRQIIADASLMAEVFDRAGGAAKFTETELARMGSAGAEAVAKLRALGEDVPQKLQSMADGTKKASGFFTDLKTQVGATVLGFVSAQAVIGAVTTAFHALTDFVLDSVKAYAEAEQAQVQLTAALRQSGQAAPEIISQYNELATTFQNTTTFSDDLITSMEGLLVQVGNVMPGQMKAALKASTDLSAGLGIDLKTATLLVAKAFASGGDDLGKLKGILGDTVPKGADMAVVLGAINDKFGGQASAQIETYAGKIAQAKNAWNNFQEQIGGAIVKSDIVSNALTTANALLGENSAQVRATADTHVHWSEVLSDLANGGPLVAATHAVTNYTAAIAAEVDTLRSVTIAQEAYDKTLEKTAAHMPGFNAAFDLLTKSSEGVDGWIKTLQSDTDKLTDKQKSQIVTLTELGADATRLAATFDVTALAITHVVAAHTKGEAAAKAYSAALQSSVGTLNDIGKVLGYAAAQTEYLGKVQADEAILNKYNSDVYRKGLEDIATQAQKTFEAARDSSSGFSQAAKDHFQFIAMAADVAAKNWESSFVDASDAGVQALDKMTAAAGRASDAAKGAAADAKNAVNFTGGVTVHAGDTSNEQRMAAPAWMGPTRAGGGPVSGGSAYMVGEKGPELFRPSGSGTIVPNGGGGGVTVVIAAGAVVLNYPVMNDPRAAAELANVVGDAVMYKLKGAGLRVPSGV